MGTEALKNKKYIIRFNRVEVTAIIPSSGGEIVNNSTILITTLDEAKKILSNNGINVSKIDSYVLVNDEEDLI